MTTKELLTWAEFVAKYPRPAGFETDYYSRRIIEQLLHKLSNKIIDTYHTEQKNPVDLIVTLKDNSKVGVEVKDRFDLTFDVFKDHMVEETKVASQQEKIRQGVYNSSSLYTIFSDGQIVWNTNVNKLEHCYETAERLCPNETTVNETGEADKMVWKICHMFRPIGKLYVYITVTDGNYEQFDCVFKEKRWPIKLLRDEIFKQTETLF